MEHKKTFGDRAEQFFAGKGFYIVLFLCVAVIGVSAWILLTGEKDYAEDEIGVDVSVLKPEADEDVFTDIRVPEEPAEVSAPAETAAPTPAETAPVEETEKPAEAPAAQETPEEVQTATAASTFVWPLQGEVEVPYSVAALVYNRTMSDWRTHDGLDIAAALGTQVMAVSAGRVESVTYDPLYGCTVVIDHFGGLKSVYANLADLPTVAAGDSVAVGEIIGAVGDTALCEAGEVSHLHFAMTLDGQSVDPADYMP